MTGVLPGRASLAVRGQLRIPAGERVAVPCPGGMLQPGNPLGESLESLRVQRSAG